MATKCLAHVRCSFDVLLIIRNHSWSTISLFPSVFGPLDDSRYLALWTPKPTSSTASL